MKFNKFTAILAAGSILFSACHSSKYMRKFHKNAKQEVGAASIKLKNDTVRVVYPELSMFDFNKDEIKNQVKPSLKRFSKVLVDFDKIDFIINGYTDTIGTEDVNQSLSLKRADNAKALFESNGVSGSRMQTNGKGSEDPIATNVTEEGRRKNRRVEFLLFEKK